MYICDFMSQIYWLRRSLENNFVNNIVYSIINKVTKYFKINKTAFDLVYIPALILDLDKIKAMIKKQKNRELLKQFNKIYKIVIIFNYWGRIKGRVRLDKVKKLLHRINNPDLRRYERKCERRKKEETSNF